MLVNIEAERVRKRLSKEELAKELGISMKTYYNWIYGNTAIPSTSLIKMKALFNASIDYLIEDDKAVMEKQRAGKKSHETIATPAEGLSCGF